MNIAQDQDLVKALKQGEISVAMIYRRSWENEYLEKQIFSVKIAPQLP